MIAVVSLRRTALVERRVRASVGSMPATPRRADATVATLLFRDRTLRGLCSRIGERRLMLDAAAEPKARTALRKLGYPLGATAR